MLKAVIREKGLAQRKALNNRLLNAYNKKILEGFKSIDLTGIKSIHVFLPVSSKKEPDTFAIIDYLEQKHSEIEIIVSKSDFKQKLMSHYCYPGKANLFLNRYHIPEPQNARPYFGSIDMVLVPLLAFDLKGYRVGYGKGFYDRFLSSIQTKKIGLSFFDAIDTIKDLHLHDVRLNMCITPGQIYTF